MRRVLFVVLAALPALALGQSITFGTNSSTINLAQCNGAQPSPDVLGLSDNMNVLLSWTVKLNDGVTIPTDGTAHYVLYASSAVVQAGASSTNTTNLCNTNNATGSPAPQAVNLQGSSTTEITVTSSVGNAGSITNQTYALKDIVAKASESCSVTSQTPVYLCAQLFVGGAASGYAIATMTLDPTVPTVAPSSVKVTPGDSKLHLSCTGGTNIGSFKATASLNGSVVARSNQSTTCSDLLISGLTNQQQYSVVVYGISGVNNPGPGSTAISDATTAPIPTNDFWNECKADGCPEKGGCSTGGLAAGLLGALSTLVVLRRRKS